MAASFCPRCGTALAQGTQFCPKCGTSGGSTAPSAISPPAHPAPGSGPSPTRKGSRGAAIAAVVVVVIIILVLALLYAAGTFKTSSSGGGGGSPQPVTENLVNTQSGTLGAGTGSAVVIPVSIPAGVSAAEVTGWFNITGCSGSGNCNAYAWVITSTDCANYKSRGSVSEIWCYTTSTTCSAVQYTVIDAVGLSGYAGTTLDLVLFNTDLLFSQTYSAYANLVYTPS